MTTSNTIKLYASFKFYANGKFKLKGLHVCLDEALEILEKTGSIVAEIKVPVDTPIDEVLTKAAVYAQEFMDKLYSDTRKGTKNRMILELCDLPRYRLS